MIYVTICIRALAWACIGKIQTHTHTNIHSQTHAYTHKHTLTCIQTYTHPHTQTQTRAPTHTHTYIHIYNSTRTDKSLKLEISKLIPLFTLSMHSLIFCPSSLPYHPHLPLPFPPSFPTFIHPSIHSSNSSYLEEIRIPEGRWEAEDEVSLRVLGYRLEDGAVHDDEVLRGRLHAAALQSDGNIV